MDPNQNNQPNSAPQDSAPPEGPVQAQPVVQSQDPVAAPAPANSVPIASSSPPPVQPQAQPSSQLQSTPIAQQAPVAVQSASSPQLAKPKKKMTKIIAIAGVVGVVLLLVVGIMLIGGDGGSKTLTYQGDDYSLQYPLAMNVESTSSGLAIYDGLSPDDSDYAVFVDSNVMPELQGISDEDLENYVDAFKQDDPDFGIMNAREITLSEFDRVVVLDYVDDVAGSEAKGQIYQMIDVPTATVYTVVISATPESWDGGAQMQLEDVVKSITLS